MKVNIQVTRYGVCLRPVTLDDAEYIFRLRRNPALSRYIGEFGDDYSLHVAWLEKNLQREDDYYFIIELEDGRPVGTIAVYDIADGRGNWGRWIVEREYPVASASVWLILQVAFDVLELSEVYSNTIVDNSQTVSFHERCGAVRDRIDRGAMSIGGTAYDVVYHTISKHRWREVAANLEPAAMLGERLLRRTASDGQA